jgi:hypothetical protein
VSDYPQLLITDLHSSGGQVAAKGCPAVSMFASCGGSYSTTV